MTKQIQLSQGKVALVDDEDFDRLAPHKWYVRKDKHGKYYALRSAWGLMRKTVYMHREIIGAPRGMIVDHVNGNALDNQRSNLRLCTNSENMCNRGKQTDNTSGYKGVTWNSHRRRWQAQIKLNGKMVQSGRFDTPEDAARAYDEAARKHHGEFAKTNF